MDGEVGVRFLRLKSVAAMAALLLPTAALAQVDPDPDGVGIYFDEGATLNATLAEVVPPNPGSATAWLIATRVATPGFVQHFEGQVEWEGYGAEAYPYLPVGWDMCWEMPVSNYDHLCVEVGPSLLAAGDIVILTRYDVFLWVPDVTMRFFLRSLRLWLYPATEVALHPANGDWNLPIAVINGEAPVPVESAAWGSVKSLFR